MWDLSKLREEVGDAVKKFPQGKKILSPEIRYHVIHLRVNRITCYLRNLLVGLFKIRITISSPVPGCRLHPKILEGFPFSPSTCEDNFRLAVPLNSLGPPDQLSFWRIEIEILHKYPAAPLYSIVARSWVSPETLSQASALDLFSTVETPSESSIPCVRMDLLSVSTSAAPVNLFRVAGKVVLCTVRLAHALARRKKTEAQLLEREIQFLITRDRNDRQDMQIDLLMRTVQVMNKYMEKGSNPEQWVSAIMKANERPDNKKLEELSSSVEALRNDVMKALLVERPPPIVQIVHAPVPDKEIEPPRSAELTDLRNEASSVRGALSVKELKDARSVIAAKGARGVMEATVQDDERRRQPKAPGVHEIENPRSVDSVKQNPQPVEETRSVVSAKQPPLPVESVVSSKQGPLPVEETTEGEGLIDEEGSTTSPKNEIIEQVEEAEDVGTTVMSALWGAFAGGQEPKVKTPSKMNTAPLIKAVSGKNPVPTTSLTKAVLGKTPVPTTSPTSKKTTTMIPPKKTNLVPKTKPPTTPVNPKTQELQQKLAVIAKIKQLEAKRKAEVDSTAAAIAQLAKKLPPIDSKKFIGLPGPPPFIPKAKVKAASNEVNGIPSAIAPPEIEEDEPPQDVDVIN